jgi:hypothetical protein
VGLFKDALPTKYFMLRQMIENLKEAVVVYLKKFLWEHKESQEDKFAEYRCYMGRV